MRRKCLTALAVALLAPAVVAAAPVEVDNFSFEDPNIPNGAYGGDGGSGGPGDVYPGFSTAGGGNGVQDWPDPGLPGMHRENVLYINGGPVFQDVGALLPNTVYTLTVSAGNQSGYGAGNSEGRISLVNGTNASGTELSGTALTNAGLPVDSLTDFTTSFQTGATVSGDLTIVLRKTAGDQVLFDNVRLDAVAVPEPAGIALAGLGGIGLLARRRRGA